MSVKKFAIIGTSSSGKSTLCYDILARLKLAHVNVDGVLQLDRRFAFDRCKLETDIEAQYVFVFNMVVKENEIGLRDGTDVLVSDRSVLDFYAYMEHQYGRIPHVFEFVMEYCKTYKQIYYLEPLPYDDDGARPSEEFRDAVDVKLRELVEIAQSRGVKIVQLARDQVFSDILSQLPDVNPNSRNPLTMEEIRRAVSILKQDCFLGGSYARGNPTWRSDVDLYLTRYHTDEFVAEATALLKSTFGVKFELHDATNPMTQIHLRHHFPLITVIKE